MQVINTPRRGDWLSDAMSNGLQQLAQMKMQQLQQQGQRTQTAKGLETILPGMKPEQYSSMAGMNPEILNQFVKSKMQEPSQQAFAKSLSGLLGGEAQPEAATISAAGPQVAEPSRLTSNQAVQLANLGLKQKKMASEERKEVRPIIEKVASDSRENRKQLETYSKMLELSEKDQVNSPEYMSGLRMMGLDNIPALLKPGTEEYNSQVVSFFGNLRKYFGAKPTVWEVKAYLQKLATAYNTKEGRRRMIRDQKLAIEAEEAVNVAKKEIIKKNKGIPPADLELQADEKAKGKVDRLWAEFRKGIPKQEAATLGEINPADVMGKIVKDTETGKRYQSDGTQFVEV